MIYATLRRASGLSLQEAADYHGVRRSSVEHWSMGRRGVPDEIARHLHALVARQMMAAREIADFVERHLTDRPDCVAVELGRPSDAHEAQTLGFPCVSAWDAAAGMALGLLPPALAARVEIVPRGSTLASAAAADAHDAAIPARPGHR